MTITDALSDLFSSEEVGNSPSGISGSQSLRCREGSRMKLGLSSTELKVPVVISGFVL